MSLCDFVQIDDGSNYRCQSCGFVARDITALPIYRNCIIGSADRCGVGTELKKLLAKFVASACGACEAHALEMDQRGISWCEGNIPTIVDWMRKEAARRGLPFVERAARWAVKRAIYNARSAGAD
jgi:hypothetical protein